MGGTGASYACTTDAPTAFTMQLTEATEVGDGSLTWAGSFAMVGSDGVDAVDMSGDFRVNSGP